MLAIFFACVSCQHFTQIDLSNHAKRLEDVQIPAEGLYLVVRDDLVKQLGNDFGLQIADYVNTYNSTPTISGKSGDTTYTFQNFVYDIYLDDFFVDQANPGKDIVLGWNDFQFWVQLDYHICVHKWLRGTETVNICESGFVIISNNNVTELTIQLNIDLSGDQVNISSSGVDLVHNPNDVGVYVQCTSSDCLLPVSTIASTVWNDFDKEFDIALTQSINQAANTTVNHIPTKFPLSVYIPSPVNKTLEVTLDIHGALYVVSPDNATHHIVLGLNGAVGTPTETVPLPDHVPDMTLFANPSSPLEFILSSYPINTALATFDILGVFDVNLEPAMLTTDNPVMLQVAPGLSQYPHMSLVVTMSPANASVVTISDKGFSMQNSLNADFEIHNETTKMEVFKLEFLVDLVASASVNGTNLVLTLNSGTVSATELSSNVGNINAALLAEFATALLSQNMTKQIPLPESGAVAYSNLEVSFQNDFFIIGSDITYKKTVPVVECNDTITVCPLNNVCCNWGGVYGCCAVPNGTCCQSGCCPQGTICDGDSCLIPDADEVVVDVITEKDIKKEKHNLDADAPEMEALYGEPYSEEKVYEG